ncbi:hypothetical protein DL766_002668 [Monosporascus sp. MC13-8B]|uniref:Tyrosine specific protein phosphatases domain-containing protein n=1 Tax=Monosporascus cannonballus TaxID=155416 RepID=A0ABY0GZ46_9PEZI|nr:hypothetical protein DL762_007478 [Monosporascus cannonballus]RYO83817.1 hypothetical protein DL763_007696 [Monosporascus cannonballus]RYP35104.1 hypothetical protein DL766_002668 [Monosporascus sp. MC13-8B]
MGSNTPLPNPPFIEIPGLPNFRDLGGYPIASQPRKVVRRGVVFRSAEPSRTTDEGVSRLQRLGITHVYDLRSEQEFERGNKYGLNRPVKEWEGARRVFAPVFRHEDYSPEAVALRFQNYGSGPESRPYHQIITHLAGDTPPPTPLLVHCTAGKDRTGVICALILSLCGVDDDIVAHEYSLTDLGLKERHQEIIAHLVQEPAFKDDPDGARRMVLAKKANMVQMLRWIKKTYGSVEKCVLDLGLVTPEMIENLRRNLIVDAQSTEKVDWREHACLLPEETTRAS